MESYVQRLLNNQQEENRLREKREQMLKRHELELEDVDEKMIAVINQRNLIMEEFQKFMANNNNNNNINNINISHLNGKNLLPVINNDVDDNNSILDDQNETGVQPKPTTSYITLKIKKPIVDNGSITECSKQSKTIDNEDNIDVNNNKETIEMDNNCLVENKSVNLSNDTATKSMNDVLKPEKTQEKSGRTLRFLPKLKTSKTAPAIPTLNRVPESPTIELMLNKVRENILDSGTLNKCIDLLSDTKSILINKNKESKEDKADLKQNENLNKADISVQVNDQNLENITASKQSPKLSPKKRIETPEERRKRIERVLFETKPAASNKLNIGLSQLSKSSSALNTIGLSNKSIQQPAQNSRSTIGLNRYVNRNKYRRNHSLSPLRFGQTRRQKSDEQSDPPSPNNSDSSKEFHKCKSEQQLYFEDSSIASFEEESIISSEFDPDKFSIQQEDDDTSNLEPEKDDDHLLAPSKVAKQQEAFKQVFFPVDVREKPLMSKKELVQIKKEKTMVKSRSMGWNTMDSIFDHTLGVDHLSHLRRSSVSPEKKQRELELNQLNNTGKFRCYQDFWEKKTTEILAKKQKYEKWQQDSTINANQAKTECKIAAGGSQKTETGNVNAKKNSLNCGQINSNNVNNSLTKPTLIPNLINDIKKLEQKSLSTTMAQPVKKKSNQNLILNIINDLKSTAKKSSTTNQMNSKKETKEKLEPKDTDLIGKKMSINKDNVENKCSKAIKLVSNDKMDGNKLLVPEEKFQKSPSPGTYSDSDSERLIEKLRFFKQDIQRQKMKMKMRQEEQRERQNEDSQLATKQVTTVVEQEERPQKKLSTNLNENGKIIQQQKEKLDKNLTMVKPDANKSLDLQYLTKHNRQSNNRPISTNDNGTANSNTSPVINRNRIKLTRAYSRDDSGEESNIMDENNNCSNNNDSKKLWIKTPTTTTTTTTTTINNNQLNRWKTSNAISLNQPEIMPMRSTYF